ncbi:MAG: hypothetical protein U1E65_10935 [Myxococcota bacterium]
MRWSVSLLVLVLGLGCGGETSAPSPRLRGSPALSIEIRPDCTTVFPVSVATGTTSVCSSQEPEGELAGAAENGVELDLTNNSTATLSISGFRWSTGLRNVDPSALPPVDAFFIGESTHPLAVPLALSPQQTTQVRLPLITASMRAQAEARASPDPSTPLLYRMDFLLWPTGTPVGERTRWALQLDLWDHPHVEPTFEERCCPR